MDELIPHSAGRVGPGWDQFGARTPEDQQEDITGYPLKKRPIEHFKDFYVDTAYFGAGEAMRTAIKFFGVDRTLFGSDSPFDPEKGPGYTRSTIANLEEMDILTDADRDAIYQGNVTTLVGL